MRDWTVDAYRAATQAAGEDYLTRRRWAGQNEWDAEHMRTESTRFTVDQDEELRRCCREARVTKYTLIGYLLRTWMAAWKSGAPRPDFPDTVRPDAEDPPQSNTERIKKEGVSTESSFRKGQEGRERPPGERGE